MLIFEAGRSEIRFILDFKDLPRYKWKGREKKTVKMEFLLSFNWLPLKTITLSTYGFLFSSRDGVTFSEDMVTSRTSKSQGTIGNG
jgi:hypothetical protein